MSSLSVSAIDRQAQLLDVPGGQCFLWYVDPSAVQELRSSPDIRSAAQRLVAANRGASIALLESHDGAATSLTMWRGLLATSELFYATLADGSIVVSDHLRNVVSRVPVADRAPTEEAIVEKYLCGWNYDRRVFCGGVQRLGYGDQFEFSATTGAIELSVHDRHELVGDAAALSGLADRIEAELDEVTRPWRSPGVAVTFSGGVDSTLLASFFDDSATMLTMTIDSPEFDQETTYAYAAAELLGRSITEHRVFERDYVDLLKTSTAVTAAPAKHYISPVLFSLDRRDDPVMIFGFGADSIFGTDRGLRRIAGYMSNSAGLAGLRAGGYLPSAVGFRSRQIRSYAEKFARPTDDPRGAAGSALAFGDTAVVDASAGSDAVDAVFDKHLDFVLDRVDIESPESDRFWRHTELVQWRDTMSDNTTVRRLAALSDGTHGVLPYTDARVIEALLEAPADGRYIKGLAGKWVLKDILAKRVPGYPVNQRKNATGLPFQRYVADGPLTGIWNQYDFPEFVDSQLANDVRANPSHVTWQALSHAVWLDEIGNNPSLVAHPTTHETALPIAGAPR
ncbi:MAG: asparagine synthase-related protein [Acidimicrobiia bacterium]